MKLRFFRNTRFGLLAAALISVLALSSAAQVEITMPDGIVLLRSTRADLEKIGIPDSTSPRNRGYTINGRNISAYFADERCTWHGWDVEPGTLISLSVKVEAETEMNVDKFRTEGFEHNIDDAFFEQFWSNEKGIRYEVDSVGTLGYVTFFPTIANAGLRCAGFPPFDISTQTYSIYFEEKLRSFSDPDFHNLLDFMTRVRDRKDLKGYILVYYKRGRSKEAERYVGSVRKLIANRDAGTAARIDIRIGGIRDDNEVEGLLLFTTQPTPRAEPKYAAPETPSN
ncbi:MAG: hypothetical protein QUS14_11335 [Pyrinomonadaceae bacterium]|nr:hypothetical protein [Pyrinomonadaceae bacterium]